MGIPTFIFKLEHPRDLLYLATDVPLSRGVEEHCARTSNYFHELMIK